MKKVLSDFLNLIFSSEDGEVKEFSWLDIIGIYTILIVVAIIIAMVN